MEDLRELRSGGPEDGVPVRVVRAGRGRPAGYRGPHPVPVQPAAAQVVLRTFPAGSLFRVRRTVPCPLQGEWRVGAVVGSHWGNRYVGGRQKVLVLMTGPVEWVYMDPEVVVERVVRRTEHRRYDVGSLHAAQYARRAGHVGVM